MTKQTITIIILSGIIIIYIVYAFTKHFTQNELETKYFQRDSIETVKENKLNDSLRLEVKKRDDILTLIKINEIGTEKERIIYLRDKKKIEEQPYNEDYEQLQEILK